MERPGNRKRSSKRRKIKAVDLFCGAGGTSTGLYLAANSLGVDVDLLAINHWPIAIETHSGNHRFARHLCESLDKIDPREIIPWGKLDLLVASPECRHHSVASGGVPKNDQSRASAFHVLRWMEALRPRMVLIENVREFRGWGPLGRDKKPLKSRKGETYKAFIISMRSLGYIVEDRVLNAADYGDPTSRKRLFILARCGNRKIVWPRPTHSEEPNLFIRKRWRAAKDIIDWKIPSQSIYDRKRPLAEKTMKRIFAGLAKYGGLPFLSMYYGTGKARSTDRPFPTITNQGGKGGGKMALCQPILLGSCGGAARSVDKPMPTLTGTSRSNRIFQPFLVNMKGRSNAASLNKPAPTQTGQPHLYIAQPFIIAPGGPKRGPRSTRKPLYTITGKDHLSMVQAFLTSVNHGDCKKSAKAENRSRRLQDPMPTLTAKNGWGLVQPYLVVYNGTGTVKPISKPVPTLTGKERFGLVTVDGDVWGLDIRFRMLQKEELAAAMSFPKDYRFAGNKSDIVKQIGNAVPVELSKSLCTSLIRILIGRD